MVRKRGRLRFYMIALVGLSAMSIWLRSCVWLAQQANPFPADESSQARGKLFYNRKCKKCHGPQGKGDGPLARSIKNIGDLSSLETASKSDWELFQIITDAKSPMPSFKRTLSEDDRWHIINYIRTFSEKSNEK